ncbi:hypothetical protein Tco_0735200 [Tanacetum coccineum]
MKSDELIKSSLENLVPIPSESEDFSDIESECDVPFCDNSITFSNPLFDANDDLSSSDDKSFSDEDVKKEIYSNPLFDEEIISDKIDASIISSQRLILSENIRLVERLLYDNLSPRPSKEFNSENSNAIIDSFSPPPIPVEDSDSLMEEINLFLTLDDSMPPDIENDDYDSKGDILFLKELLSNDSPSLPENDSSNLDHFNDPLSLVLLQNHRMLRSENKIFDPGIFIEVQSERLLSREEFSISFIRDPLSPVFTLLRFHPKTKKKCSILDFLRS